MRAALLLALGCFVSFPAVAALYKHVDDNGNVTYSDRPLGPQQEALQLPPPNVATPEARRQLDIARLRMERQELAEYTARMQRAAAVQRSAPAVSSRPLTRNTHGYATPVYYAVYARTPSQSNPPQGLRPPGVPHRAHSARH